MSKMNRFFAKVGRGFRKFGEKVENTCDSAAESVRAKGLEIRIDEQYENLGRLTYRAQHTGEDLEQNVMEIIAKIEALFDELEQIKAAKAARKEKAEEECDECTEEAAAEEAPAEEAPVEEAPAEEATAKEEKTEA